MSYAQIVFSPTGGTARVADILTKNWSAIEKIDLSKAETDFSEYKFTPEDIVLIAMPSFGGLAPKPAIDRLSQISGNGAKGIVVAVYGNRAYEDTLVQMQDTAEKSGFHVIAGVSAVAEHSIIRQYAAGRPNQSDVDQLSSFAAKIADKISGKSFKDNSLKDKSPENKSLEDKFPEEKPLEDKISKLVLPGNRPYKKAGGVSLVPKCTSSCTSCGLCAKACPVQAINLNNPQVTDGNQCISCMRCVSLCPENARKVNSVMTSAAALAIKKACSEKKENELFI